MFIYFQILAIQVISYLQSNVKMVLHFAILVSAFSLSGCVNSTSDNALSSVQDNVADTQSESVEGLQIVSQLPTPVNASGNITSAIAENDLLEISVFQVDDLNRTVRVDANGNISMPLIGQVKALDLTVSQLEQSLEAKYNKNYLQAADISVFVKESFGERITMDGQFVKPGIYAASSQTTLLQTVALASGLTELADEEKVFVYREHNGIKKVAKFSIKDIRSGKKSDPRIYGGDVVVAFTSKAKIGARNLRQALGIATSAVRVATPL